ncbi:hypothetical protein ACWEV9_35655 [Streptomyces albogriseolus]|uniref:hypothetical protein n=1 Tax=Streptomyces albogriseolus group TaxID=2867120 RepID=UPI0018753A82
MNKTARPTWSTPSAVGQPAWVKALAISAGVATAIWTTWCTVIALLGGTMPLIGYHAHGDVLSFLLMLFVGEPILITSAYWACLLIVLTIRRVKG